MAYELFRTRRGKGRPKPGSWTEVVLKVRDSYTGKFTGELAVVTAFGGSGGGLSEAKRLCQMLNQAYERFHYGDPVPTSAVLDDQGVYP